MSETPLVSVLMTAYDREKLIETVAFVMTIYFLFQLFQ